MTSGFGIIPAAVNASSATETGVATEMSATTAAGAAALTGVTPMATDLDTTAFTMALNATGTAYLASMADHVQQRTAFAGAQSLASTTYEAVDAIHGTALG
jgi:hypothetical protein